jgi:hypothetical protein
MISLLILSVFCAYTLYQVLCLRKELRQAEKDAEHRHNLQSDWLFQSLYSINHNVKLPEEVSKKPSTTRKATVYNYHDDPKREFDVGLDEVGE